MLVVPRAEGLSRRQSAPIQHFCYSRFTSSPRDTYEVQSSSRDRILCSPVLSSLAICARASRHIPTHSPFRRRRKNMLKRPKRVARVIERRLHTQFIENLSYFRCSFLADESALALSLSTLCYCYASDNIRVHLIALFVSIFRRSSDNIPTLLLSFALSDNESWRWDWDPLKLVSSRMDSRSFFPISRHAPSTLTDLRALSAENESFNLTYTMLHAYVYSSRMRTLVANVKFRMFKQLFTGAKLGD